VRNECIYTNILYIRFYERLLYNVLNDISVSNAYVNVLTQASKVQWPPELVQIYKALSFFNLNLDLFPPECSLPHVEYKYKWLAIESFPFVMAAPYLFLLIFVVFYSTFMRKSLFDNQLAHVTEFFIRNGLSFFYIIYMYLMRTQLDVFSCYPTVPNDGHTYADFTSVECGGLCRCWEKGSVQMWLFPFALGVY
jgi:hypothetical protein